MEDKILAAKLFFGAAGLALSLVASKWALIGASSREFRITATTLLVASRLLLFISLFIILGFSAQSDVTVYYTQAKAVRAGLVPYRDFPLSYAPLFPYINAAAVAMWDSPKSIVLLAVLFELAAFPLWLSISSVLFSEREARLATLLYVTSPVPIVNVSVAGQNQVWVMLALGAAIILAMRNRYLASGIAAGASVVAVKFLALLFLPPLFAGSSRRARWSTGLMSIVLLVYGFVWWQGLDLLAPLKTESLDQTAGNLPFLMRALWPAVATRLFDIVALLALTLGFVNLTGLTVRKSLRELSFSSSRLCC